jgi:hypothetical protein
LDLKRSSAVLALVLSCAASAAEVRPGVGLALGASPGIPTAPLVAAKLDIQVEGGDRSVAFFAAARFSTYFFAQSTLFTPTIEAGARWHVSRKITLGLAIAAGAAVLFGPDGGTLYMVGATIEPFTWSLTPHHELGLVITALLPASRPLPSFNVLVLPAVGYTYHF